jgi:hypothetical protein
MRKMLFALAAQAVAAGVVLAQAPTRPTVAPIVPCPPTFAAPIQPCPPGMVMPGMPGSPGSPVNPPVPDTPPNVPPAPTPDVSGAFARQTEGGGQAGGSFAPNMFGDVLGSRAIRVQLSTPFSLRGNMSGSTVPTATGLGRVVNLSNGVATFGGGNSGIKPSGDIALPNDPNLQFTQVLNANGTANTVYAQNALQTLLSSGGLTPGQINALNQLTPAQRAQLLANRGAINQTITQYTQGLAIQTLTVSQISTTAVPPVGSSGDITYTGALLGEQNVPLPGGSTLVGRVKLSEDNSPLPRDRFIFSYDHFDNVPLTGNGFTVNRFQFGVEKTFLDGRWSFEFRMPFSGTVASTNVQGFEVGHTEFGNVRFALKRIFSQNQVLTTTSGIAVTLPTADDQVLLSSVADRNGSNFLYRFENEQVTVEPFVAAIYTPNQRLFAQTWGSINFDVSGGELSYNKTAFEGTDGIGRVRFYDIPFLSVDQQVGYWLIQRDYGTLRGLAPFVELHWNYAIAQRELLNEVNKRLPNNGLSVGSVADHELNLIAGVLTQVGDNLNLSIGASAPLLQRPNRTFDAQVGVRASYLFGRTARARNPIYSISSY